MDITVDNSSEIIDFRTPQGHDVVVHVRYSSRNRKLKLRHSVRGEFKISAPLRIDRTYVRRFLTSNGRFVDSWIARAPEKLACADGDVVRLFDRDWTIRRLRSGESLVDVKRREIVLVCDDEFVRRRMRRVVGDMAKAVMLTLTKDLTEKTGKQFHSIEIVDSDTRWGSASKSGRIKYHWIVAFAPLYVARYLVAHEVAHLTHMHHRASFWRLVNDLDPNWREAERWLNSPQGLSAMQIF